MNLLGMSISLAAILASSECGERCDAKPIPVSGHYVWDGAGGDSVPFRSVSMQVDDQTVTVEYERSDGSRWRANYRITARVTRS